MAESEERRVQNTFSGGMWTDTLLSLQPDGTYRESWSGVIESDEENAFGLSNEGATELCANIPDGYVPRGHYFVEERDWHVVFSTNGSSSEIGYIDNKLCTYIKIIDDECINDGELGFTLDTWVKDIESKVIHSSGTSTKCNELWLYWSHNDFYFRLNVDRCGCEIDYEDILLFNCQCIPQLSVLVSDRGGVDLETGAYQFVAQGEDEVGNKTNWFWVSEAAYIGSENNLPGEQSEQSITVFIEKLNEDYPKINIAVIHKGIAKKVGVEYYTKNGISFTYSSQSQFLGTVSSEEILIRKSGYIRGSGLIQHDGRLFLYGLRGERNVDFQETANDIKVTYQIGRVPIKYAHLFKGLRANEVYAAGIHFNYCDGTKTRVFHIPNNTESVKRTIDCIGCDSQVNTAYRTDTFSDTLDDTYSETKEKADDVYDPFVPSEQEILNADSDGEVPNISSITPGGEGCDCQWVDDLIDDKGEAYVIDLYNDIVDAIHQFTDPSSQSEIDTILNSIEILKQLCACGVSSEGISAGAGGTPVSGLNTTFGGGGIVPDNTDPIPGMDDTERDDSFSRRSCADGTCPEPSGGLGASGSRNTTGDETDPADTDPPDAIGADGTIPTDAPGSNPNVSTHHTGGSFPNPYHGNTQGGETIKSANLVDNDCEPTIIYKDGDTCCEVLEVIPCIDAEGELSYWESCETYPLTKKCCSDEYLYGDLAGQPIRHLKMPSRDKEPHFISFQDGVPTAQNLDNKEDKDGYVRLIWLKVDGITLPNEELLDKPLCEENPFTISIVKRDATNKSVVMSGVVINTYDGVVHKQTQPYAVPRNIVNGVETVDRYIENNGTRKGKSSTDPNYILHSPDTHFDRPNIDVDYVHFLMRVYGKGKRHGLYGEGIKPDKSSIARQNSKGARHAVNLNHYETYATNYKCMKAISYAPADSVVDKSDQFSKGLLNLSRESSVYFETEGSVVGNFKDDSFVGDVYQQERLITKAEASYADFIRHLPSQYGGVQNLSYYPLHHGTKAEAEAGTCIVKNGDSFVNTFSVKRTAYVSDRVGDDISPPYEFGGGILGLRFIGNLLKNLFNNVGAEECGTVPKSGNSNDPRNNNTKNGLRGPAFTSNVSLSGDSTYDTYFPGVVKGLVTFFVDTDVNLKFRGSGDSPETAIYRDLNGLTLDSSFVGGEGDFESSWLDRFYVTMSEIPKWKMIARVILNFLFTYGIGIWIILKGNTLLWDTASRHVFGFVNSGPGYYLAIATCIFLIILGIFWIVRWANTNLDNKFWDNVLGIGDCFPDIFLGGDKFKMKDNRLRGFEDNHFVYDYEYSKGNWIDRNFGLPDPYNTCGCLNEKTHEIVFSNKQNPVSGIDSYRNFENHQFLEIPTHTGPIINLFRRGNKMYAHTTDMIWVIARNTAAMQAGSFDAIELDRPRVLQVPIPMFQGPSEGYAGMLDANCAINTDWGYIFIDREARKIFLFSGEGLKELSSVGMRNFLNNNLDFKLLQHFPDYENVDQKSPLGIGYSIGVDHHHNRILITKVDYEPLDGVSYENGSCTYLGEEVVLGDPKYFCDKSFTLSYSFLTNKWVSYHWYKPLLYTWNRFDMFSFEGNGMWKHDMRGKFNEFYGVEYPHMVEFVIRDSQTMKTFKYNSSILDTEAYRYKDYDYIRNHRKTFDKIIAYNSHQGSGELEFHTDIDNEDSILDWSMENPNNVKLFFNNRKWQYADLVDKLISYDDHMFLINCEMGPTLINEENLSTDIKNNSFTDNYLVNRLFFSKFDEDFTNTKIFTKIVDSSIDLEE